MWPNGYNAWLSSTRSQVQFPTGSINGLAGLGLVAIKVCGGVLSIVLATGRPTELFVKRKKFLPGSGFLSNCDMT